MEANIDAAESELEKLEKQAFEVAQDLDAAKAIEAQRQATQRALEDWMAQWEALELTIEESKRTKE